MMNLRNRPLASLLTTILALSLIDEVLSTPAVTQGDDRKLDIVQDWAVKFIGAEHVGGNNVVLEFEHGSGGTPAVKIYGNTFDPNRQSLIGETCLSLGGAFNGDPTLAPPGVTLVATDATEPTEGGMFKYRLEVQIDSAALAAPLATEVPNGSVLQYCIWFSLMNAAGEEANFVEVEVRFVNTQDGTIVLESFDIASAIPIIKDFTTSIGLEAKICKMPAGPGDTVEICITTTDPLATIDTVQDFSFSSGDGTVVQNAFTGGAPDSLTQVLKDSGSVFTFETILQGDFYLASTKKVTSVGVATLSTTGERRALKVAVVNGANTRGGNGRERALKGEARVMDVPLKLVFELGKGIEGMTIHDDFTAIPGGTKSPKNNGNQPQASIAITTLSASMLVLFMATVGLIYGRRCHAEEPMESITNEAPKSTNVIWV